jgi:hypothetical protein
MENQTFYIKYLDNQPVKIQTHIDDLRIRREFPLKDVDDLVAAAIAEPARRLLGLPQDHGPLTLHSGMDEEALEVDALLTGINTGTTAKTALIMKSKILPHSSIGYLIVENAQDTLLELIVEIKQKLDYNGLQIDTYVIPFIEQQKLELFPLVASSERSDNQALKLDCLNYYNTTALTRLPQNITCQFLGIEFPTNQVTCSHLFQKKWAKSRAIIDLKDINDVKNLLLLFKPIEMVFDEGRICFLWDNSSNQFKMIVLDPEIRSKTVLDLATKQFPNYSYTSVLLNRNFAALEGSPLNTGNFLPLKRCLAFHASRARYEAIHIRKWINAEEFVIPDDAWSPDILENPELKSHIESWLNKQ